MGRLSTSLKNGPNRIWEGLKKGGQLDWKLGKRGSIGLNINTMRGQSDRAWLFEGFEDAEKGTQSDWKSQKRGSSSWNLPTMSPGLIPTTPLNIFWILLISKNSFYPFNICQPHYPLLIPTAPLISTRLILTTPTQYPISFYCSLNICQPQLPSTVLIPTTPLNYHPSSSLSSSNIIIIQCHHHHNPSSSTIIIHHHLHPSSSSIISWHK